MKAFFFTFWKFCFGGLLEWGEGGGGCKRGKIAQMSRNSVFHTTPYISGTIHHDLHLWYNCVKGYCLEPFFAFSKWGKKAKNDKKFCLLHSLS